MTRRAAAILAAGLLALAGCSTEVAGSASPGSAASSPAASSGSDATAAPSSTAAESPGPGGTSADCEWLPSSSGLDVGTPPGRVPAAGTATLVMTLGQGELTLTLDREAAPCAAASMAYLADVGFFDGSPCHREVNQPTFGVLQCGDPTGTGRGGPAYRFAEEVTDDTTYPAGAVAMANSGSAGSTGSQFFICFVDTELPPAYTVVGTLDAAGLAVVREIAAAGNDGSFEPSPGGGAPNEPVVIESAEVVA